MFGKVGNKFLIIESLIVIVLFLYVSLPLIFMGSSTPVFQIFNDDIKSHEVTVEVFNPDNESIINKT